MKNILLISLICTLFGCNLPMNKSEEIQGKIRIVYLYNLGRGGISSPIFLMHKDTAIYYLNFQATTVQEGLSSPYQATNTCRVLIGKDSVYLHSNTTYLVTGDIDKTADKTIMRMDNSVREAPGINKQMRAKIINVKLIKEISRTPGSFMIYLRFPTEGGSITMNEKPVELMR